MDAVVIVIVMVLAVALAIAIGVANERGRALAEIRRQIASGEGQPVAATDDGLAGHVGRLVATAASARTAHDAVRQDLASVIEFIGIGIARLTDERRIDVANAAAHALLGRPTGSLIGLTITGAFLDARIEAIVETARRSGSATGEVRLRPDGAALIIRARRSPVQGLWLVLEDVSELRRLQQIRAEFIDNLSHELRTPLTTISLLAETLTREAEAAGDVIPSRMRDRIGKIEVETGHLVQMVSELLDLSRIETGAAPILIDDIDLARLAIASTERLRLFAERQGVVLSVDVPSVVPLVRGDEARIGQVLVNLLHNAVKFSPDGGDVTVLVRTEPGEVVTSVEDHGVGVPKHARSRVFERFYKVDRARARGEAGGTGLGLAIARHVIEQHGGRIWVESEEGRGSTFAFALPVPPARP